MTVVFEWIIFLALSAIAIVTAAGMILTMSMYRAALALMASFVALAGLFILLGADLLAAIQVMMNVGGMLVMVLFMVMIMMDPGGEMMWGMKRGMHIPGLAAFSMTMPRGKPPEESTAQEKEQRASDWTCPMHPEVSQSGPGTCPKCGMTLMPRAEMTHGDATQDTAAQAQTYTCPMHPEVRQNQPGSCPKCGMQLIPAENAEQLHQTGGHQNMSLSSTGNGQSDQSMNMSHSNMDMSGMMSMTPRQYYDMMVGMAMSTAQLPWALVLGAVSAFLLIILVVITPWPVSQVGPTQDATNAVGNLLLSRYMIGFEGAAFLILAGIAGAVILAKREPTPGATAQVKQVEAGGSGQQVYTCPMHPEVRQNHPGNCPKCGMSLIPAEETTATGSSSTQGGQA